MLGVRIAAWLFAALAVAGGAGPAQAQNFPARAIRIITPPPGGSNDLAARLIAQDLAVRFNSPVVVDNRPAGVIQGVTVSKAPADGYTLLLYGNAFWLLPLLEDDVPYDPVKDFAPITEVAEAPNIIVISPTLPVNSLKEFIAYAKARPKALNFASSATGSISHLGAELFNMTAGVELVRINYKATNPALTDLMSGQVHMMLGASGAVTPLVKTGKLKALGVTSLRPSALAPGMPTVAQSGLPGFESNSVYGIFAPARTPAAIVGQLNREVVRILDKPEVKEKFLDLGIEAVSSSPEQFGETMKQEMSKWGRVIKAAGIRSGG